MYYTKTPMEHLHINKNFFLCCSIFSSFIPICSDVVQLPVLSEQAVCVPTFKLFQFVVFYLILCVFQFFSDVIF